MSKTNTSKTEKQNSKASSHGFLKFLSVLLLAVFVAALFIPKYLQLSGTFTLLSGSVAGKDQSVFAVISDDVKSLSNGGSILNLISAHKIAWTLTVCAVILLISTIITLCCKKSAGGWFGIDCGILVVVALPYAYKCLLGSEKYIDLFLVACVLALIFLIVAAFARGKGKNVLPVICFIALSAVMALTCMYNFFPEADAKNLFSDSASWYLSVIENLASGKAISSIALYEMMTYITFGVLLACWILTVFQLGTVKKTTWFTVIRYLALLGVSVASLIIILTDKTLVNDIGTYFKDYPYYIVLVAVAFVVFLLSLIAKLTAKKKVKETKAEGAETESQEEGALDSMQGANEPPVYNAPVYAAPVYPAPVYPAPVYAAPVYAAPTYGNPAYGENPNSPVAGQTSFDRRYDKNARMAPPANSPENIRSSRSTASASSAYSPYAPMNNGAMANQPVSSAYPMPNIYINITSGSGETPAEVKVTSEEAKPAVQTAVVTTSSAATTPVAEPQGSKVIEEKADLIEKEIREEEVKKAEAVKSAPVVNAVAIETTTVADAPKTQTKQKTKRRSFWLFLGVLLMVAALAVYAFFNGNSALKIFTEFSLTLENILPVAFLGGGVLAVLFGLISLAGANKPCGVIAFLFTVVSAAGYLVNVQMYGERDILASVKALDYEFIATAACAILAVLFCLIGAARTGKLKNKEVTTSQTNAVAPAQKEGEPAKAEKASAVSVAPVAAQTNASVESTETVATEEEINEPEEEIEDPFIKSLSVLNKKEFRKTFLEGNPPSYLPEYEINGDNADFFDAVFVYLGKVRSVISPSLLAAIYDYINK